MQKELSIVARWVFRVAESPIERGVVTVRDGRIVAVGAKGSRSADIDFGNAAIVPGFVNAHTHLDLSGARGLTPPQSDFTQWLRSVIAYRRTRTPEQVEDDIRTGISECFCSGTTLIGDIAAGGQSWDALSTTAVRGVVFRELIGLSHDRGRQALQEAKDWLGVRRDTDKIRQGLSPHAPYSINYSAIQAAAKLGMPIAVHVAESKDEIELMESQTGRFVGFLEELGAWDEAGPARNAKQVLELMRASPRALIVHANYVDPATSIGSQSSIVYCPRTHAAFGHPPHPFREFLKRGVRVALGTDSLASNPDLSILAEARFIASRHPDFDRATLLRMATLSGAEALGWESDTGSLETGKSADFAVIELPVRDDAHPHELLFHSDLAVQSTWFQGECVYSALPSAGAPGRG